MKKYFIDEAETFAISDDLDARVELMGWQETPIVYIDNFYKNPDKVRNLALRCPGTNNPRVCGNLPGVRVDMNMNLDHMHEIWQQIAENVYGLKMNEVKTFKEACKPVPFSVNVTQSEFTNIIPHVDYPPEYETRGWAGLIYLNKPKECKGGTGFYTYNGQQVNPDQDGIWRKEHVTDSVGPWELIHLSEMKYNRMIMYPDQILHTAYDKPGWFEGDTYRLVQVFFIPLHFPS